MRIGEAAEQSQLPTKTIRFYEKEGLINPAERQANGYRSYSSKDVHTLLFLKRARSLGFSLQECRVLLSLYRDRERSSADVKRIAKHHLADIERKIEELLGLKAVLGELVDKCHWDDRPDCPILDDLAKAGHDGVRRRHTMPR